MVPRAQLVAAWAERQLDGAVRLRFVDCIGPCDPANLAVIQLPGEAVWLAGLDGAQLYDALADWAEQSRDGGAPAVLSSTLTARRILPPRADLPGENTDRACGSSDRVTGRQGVPVPGGASDHLLQGPSSGRCEISVSSSGGQVIQAPRSARTAFEGRDES